MIAAADFSTCGSSAWKAARATARSSVVLLIVVIVAALDDVAEHVQVLAGGALVADVLGYELGARIGAGVDAGAGVAGQSDAGGFGHAARSRCSSKARPMYSVYAGGI